LAHFGPVTRSLDIFANASLIVVSASLSRRNRTTDPIASLNKTDFPTLAWPLQSFLSLSCCVFGRLIALHWCLSHTCRCQKINQTIDLIVTFFRDLNLFETRAQSILLASVTENNQFQLQFSVHRGGSRYCNSHGLWTGPVFNVPPAKIFTEAGRSTPDPAYI
jgi:hypothetical protein